MKHTELFHDAQAGDPISMFKMGVAYYWGGADAATRDRRKAFELLSRAMEIGLPKERKYYSGSFSELSAARFLAVMLLRDDDGIVSNKTGLFWFEKPRKPYIDTKEEWSDQRDEISEKDRYEISGSISKILMIISDPNPGEQALTEAANIAQSIVLDLSFGDRDHDPAIALRTILQEAAEEKRRLGKVKLSWWSDSSRGTDTEEIMGDAR